MTSQDASKANPHHNLFATSSLRSINSISDGISNLHKFLADLNVPKRRLSDVSQLGVPKWYLNGEAPLPLLMPGTKKVDLDVTNGYLSRHGMINPGSLKGGGPLIGGILYSAAPAVLGSVRYYNQARVKGEVHLKLSEPIAIKSVDVFLLGTSTGGIYSFNFLRSHAHLWDLETNAGIVPVEHGTMSSGSYILPFEFKELPEFVPVENNSAWVPLPPSYYVNTANVSELLAPSSGADDPPDGVGAGLTSLVHYVVRIVVEYKDPLVLPAIYDLPFAYCPAFLPIPKPPTPFPAIHHRIDWPFKREVIQGWSITPFGGRGKFKGEMVELEGLLGIQSPEVYLPGQRIHYSLLLWSSSPLALQELSDPKRIDVSFMSSDLFGQDVLHPERRSVDNRRRKTLAKGRIWLTEDGPPEEDRITTIDEKLLYVEDIHPKSPSPTPSIGDGTHYHGDYETFVERLDGDVTATYTLPPSFRYEYVGREYLLNILIKHPDFHHLSPYDFGIEGETPLWMVFEPTHEGEKHSFHNLPELPLVGKTIDTGAHPIRLPDVIGGPSTKHVPTRGLEEKTLIRFMRGPEHA